MSGAAFVVRTAGGIHLWQVNLWSARGIVHGFTGRGGGVSPPPFDSLNLGLHVGDDPERVRENRRRLCGALGVSPRALVVGEQVHGGAVALVTRADMGRGALDAAAALPGVDALICAEPGPVLMGLFADCVPVLLMDERTPAVAMVHAGWRGTRQRVVTRTLEAMSEAFGTRPEDCWAALGPAIGPCCYEVGREVAEQFASWGNVVVQRAGRLHLDLWTANRNLLDTAGVPSCRIVESEICTRCHMDRCFSYRGSAGCTGRMAAVIGL